MRRRRRAASIRPATLFLLALMAAAVGCSGPKDFRPLGAATLAETAEQLLLNAFPEASFIRFDHGYEGEGVYAPDRFPAWAREGFYDHCVAWRDGFRALRSDRSVLAEGTVWGWVLVTKENLLSGSRVLELSYEDSETAARVVLVDGWGLQPVEFGVETLASTAEAAMAEAIPDAKYVIFETGYEGAGSLAEDRFPDWAGNAYDLCVYWEDRCSVVHEQGNRVDRGDVWGWVLVSGAGRTHVLEVSYRFEGADERVQLIDQWEGPETP